MSDLPVIVQDAEPQRATGGGLEVRSMDDLGRMAKMVADSGMFRDGSKPLTAHQAGVKMLFAMAMGFEPITGLVGVDIIEGNPSPNGHFWAAALESHDRYDYEVVESTSEKCVIRFLRDGKQRGVVTWTLEDAKHAGLAGKDNWRKYPRAMLYNRAMTEGGRMHCPQLFGGVRAYVPEELRPDVRVAEPVEAPDRRSSTVGVLEPFGGAEDPQTILVPSETDPDVTYTISPDLTSCTCKAYEFSPAPKSCKHIQSLQETLA